MEDFTLEHEDMLPSTPPMSLTDPVVPQTMPIEMKMEDSSTISQPRQRRWMFPLIILILVTIAGCLLFTTRAWVSSSPQHAVNAFFDNVESGQTAIAYTETAPVFKKVGTLEQFEALVKDKPQLFFSKRTFTSLNVKGNEADARGLLTLEDNSEVPLRITLVREKDTWKISGFSTGDDAK